MATRVARMPGRTSPTSVSRSRATCSATASCPTEAGAGGVHRVRMGASRKTTGAPGTTASREPAAGGWPTRRGNGNSPPRSWRGSSRRRRSDDQAAPSVGMAIRGAVRRRPAGPRIGGRDTDAPRPRTRTTTSVPACSRDEARRQAALAFGSVDAVTEQYRYAARGAVDRSHRPGPALRAARLAQRPGIPWRPSSCSRSASAPTPPSSASCTPSCSPLPFPDADGSRWSGTSRLRQFPGHDPLHGVAGELPRLAAPAPVFERMAMAVHP